MLVRALALQWKRLRRYLSDTVSAVRIALELLANYLVSRFHGLMSLVRRVSGCEHTVRLHVGLELASLEATAHVIVLLDSILRGPGLKIDRYEALTLFIEIALFPLENRVLLAKRLLWGITEGLHSIGVVIVTVHCLWSRYTTHVAVLTLNELPN